MKTLTIATMQLLFALHALGQAVTISSSGREVEYSFKTSFRSVKRGERLTPGEAKEAARFHASHLFGLFHSPEVAAENGYPSELIEGFAGTKRPEVSDSESFKVAGDPYLWVKYHGHGTLILHKLVLRNWLRGADEGTVILPLLKDLPAIYSDDLSQYRVRSGAKQSDSKWAHCTDKHYWQSVDFHYFYTPYKCEELRTEPVAAVVKFQLKVAPLSTKATAGRFPSDKIYAANENGRLVTFYFASGFDEPDAEKIRQDSGWKSFAYIEKLLVTKYGFRKMKGAQDLRQTLGTYRDQLSLQTPVQMVHDSQRRYFSTFVKKEGGRILVARSGLFNTEFERTGSPRRSFPKYWKEAWENGDVIFFGGHSGDGESLNLNNLLGTLESSELDGIMFNTRKTQVAIFDSCSSYAWYQDIYASRHEGLHLITFGLVSLFHLAKATLEEFIAIAMEEKSPTWENALARIEGRQLNSHVAYYYEPGDRAEQLALFRRRHWVPTSLMNVRFEVPAATRDFGRSSE